MRPSRRGLTTPLGHGSTHVHRPEPPIDRNPLAALLDSRSEAEHQGRVSQPGVPAGPRDGGGRSPGSESAGYHGGDFDVPGWKTQTPVTAPTEAEAATTPGEVDTSTARRDFHRAVVHLPPPARRVTLAAISNPLRPTETPPRPTTATQDLAEILGRALAGRPAALSAPAAATPEGDTHGTAEAALASYDPATAPQSQAQKLATDPLGAKTLGDVTEPQLAHAAKTGTLRVSQKGVLSTPQNRQALSQLRQARAQVSATNGLQGPLTGSQKRIAELVSRDTGGILKPRTVATQELQEESGAAARQRQAEHNYDVLNIGYTDSGPLPLTQDPAWSDPRTAAKATAQFFEGKRFSPSPAIAGILEQAKGQPVARQLQAIGNSGWASSDYAADLAKTSNLVSERHDPAALASLRQAKQNARTHGINPTPFNGDVEGGNAEYTYVRADAKGMVDWLESAVGTKEGSPRQLHWAAKLGLGSTEPWCANLVSNGLLRRGFSLAELPENLNNTGTPGYEQWGREGKFATDLGTDLAKAKPGDVLTFSGAHTATYVGNGEMISGNFANEVERTPVSAGPAPLSMIIRPKYKGGRVKVKDERLPGSTAAGATGAPLPEGDGSSVSSTPGVGGAGGIGRPSTGAAAELVSLQSPFDNGPSLPGVAVDPEGREQRTADLRENLLQLLGDEEGTGVRGRPYVAT